MKAFSLETPRLILREFQVEDAPFFYALNLDAEVIRYTGDPPFTSLEAAKAFLLAYDQYQRYGMGRWAVIRKSDDAYLGWCGLKYSPDVDEVDLGFRFFRQYWNQGFATEASLACLSYGFQTLKLDLIVGRAMRANTASIRVLEKLGFTYWKTMDFDQHEGVCYRLERDVFRHGE